MLNRTSDQGMSLVELMVVLGVMSVVTVGLATLVFEISRTQSHLEAIININDLIAETKLALGESASCDKSFGIGVAGASAQTFDPVLAARNEVGDGLPVRITLPNNTVLAEGLPLPNYRVRLRKFYLENGPTAQAGDGIYNVRLTATFEPGVGLQREIAPRKIGSMSLRVAGGIIVQCLASGGGAGAGVGQWCGICQGTQNDTEPMQNMTGTSCQGAPLCSCPAGFTLQTIFSSSVCTNYDANGGCATSYNNLAKTCISQ